MVQPQFPGYIANWRFFIPSERAREAEKRDRVPYGLWEEQGYISLTSGQVVDYSAVESCILEDCERYNVAFVGYDPWNAEATRQRLEANGVQMVKVRQGYASLSEACKDLEASVLSGTFRHGGNPIAEWMAEHVEVETDVNGNIRPRKPEHGAYGKRIDGIVAAVNAIAVAIASPLKPVEVLDYYEDNDLEMV